VSEVFDPFFKLKTIAYIRTKFPQGFETVNLFVDHCKTTLCFNLKIAYKDPLWDSYTDEEIIIEYYCHVYNTNKAEADKMRASFVKEEDFFAWTEKMMKKNEEDLDKKREEMEDVNFSPDIMGS